MTNDSIAYKPSSALRFTRLRNNKGALTKTYALDAQNVLTKTTNAALYDGIAELVECVDLPAFMTLRAGLEPNEALMFGTTGRKSVAITTRRDLQDRPLQRESKVARDAESVHYPHVPGVLLIDHDSDHLAVAYDRDSLRTTILGAVPELRLAPMAWATSASSHIRNAETGEELQGLRGQRLYVPIADATDIPRVGRIIYERLWAADLGAFVVSKSGSLLDRNLIDASAWQAERIDFAAGAQCVAPLRQDAPAWHVWEADIFGGVDPWDSRLGLAELTQDHRDAAAKHRATARALVEGPAREARAGYIEERAAALAAERGVDIDEARALLREAVEHRLLFADFVLQPEKGEPVTVGQLLDDPGRWHGTRFADPLEPSYRGDKRIAWCNLRSGGRPYLFSWAHGLDQRYELVRQPAQLRVQPGENARLADECLRVMRERGDVFDFGTTDMARVSEGQVYACTRGWVLDYLSRHVRFTRFDSRAKKGEDANKPTDCPDKVANAIVDRMGERSLSKLRGVITAPTLRADGTVLDVPGFDAQTGLLFVSDSPTTQRVNASPTRSAVIAALRELMEPIQLFPFADAASRGVALAALLSACVRRTLPRCPAFAFDAPTAGTGKSLLAQCVAAIGGHTGASYKPPTSDEEMGKVVFAALRAGEGLLFFDNVSSSIGGDAVNQLLTSEFYAGRVLGSSVAQSALPNGALVLFTGNNIVVEKDSCRRVPICRLDARVEHPSRRSFAFDPEQFVRARRARLVGAALTLVRGWCESGAEPKPKPLGSFEAWDSLIRQTVCWLGDIQTEFELADPNLTTERTDAADDSKVQLRDVLRAWREAFGYVPVTASGALSFAQGDDTASINEKADCLRVALAALARHPRDEMNPVRLGQWLKQQRERVVAGLRFEGFLDRKETSLWFVAGEPA